MGINREFPIVAIAIAFFVFLSGFQSSTKKAPINATPEGIALKGYDTVEYFDDGKAVKGDAQISFDWMGARWHFANTGNRDLFARNPQRYAPQYGGYCAYGVSRGYFADVDPTVWKIVNDKLYLNYDAKVGKTWSKDPEGYISKADANWPKLSMK